MEAIQDFDGKLSINVSATIQNIEEIKEKSLNILDNSEFLLIDFSDCGQIDLSVVQCILASGKTALALGKRVMVKPDSAGLLLKTMARAGLVNADGKVIVGEKLFDFDKGQ
ncbi:STAS domain-containing protein [Lacibacterium aquatile]|uniref:STAS domain-containing protein n=1 Tax=Lacibacterium aquatile TaxID=1168082 RepID=A0ABW5DMP8_9PROT